MRSNISLILLFVVAISCTSWAEEPVYFADPNLKAAVEVSLGVVDPNATDMLALTSVTARSSGISSLVGLEFATNLQRLEVRENLISDISPLAGLTNLDWLELSDNQISNISALSALTRLERLWLNRNEISDISPLSELKSLDWLSLAGNQISDLSPLSGLTSVRLLTLSENQISDVSVFSELPALDRLSLDGNQIRDVSPLASLTILRSLYLYRNDISDISPLSALMRLESLGFDDNHITDLSPLAGFTSLRNLGLERNEISDISSLSGLTGLGSLNLRENQIRDLSPLSGLITLRFLFLSRNNISDISPLSGLLLLRVLDASYNQISDLSPLSGHVYLEKLYLWANPLSAEAYTIYIPLLESYGTIVYHSSVVRRNLVTGSTAGGSVAEPGELALCVDNNAGYNPNEDGSPERPYNTIQEAVDVAEPGEVVLVYPGVYQEEVDFLGKAITVQGVATADGIAVLENPGGIAVSFGHGEGPDSVLKNIVVRNNAVAIFVAGSSPTIANITFARNTYGVGAYNLAEPDISNCIFWGNTGADLYQCQARYSRVQGPGEGNISADPLFLPCARRRLPLALQARPTLAVRGCVDSRQSNQPVCRWRRPNG